MSVVSDKHLLLLTILIRIILPFLTLSYTNIKLLTLLKMERKKKSETQNEDNQVIMMKVSKFLLYSLFYCCSTMSTLFWQSSFSSCSATSSAPSSWPGTSSPSRRSHPARTSTQKIESTSTTLVAPRPTSLSPTFVGPRFTYKLVLEKGPSEGS